MLRRRLFRTVVGLSALLASVLLIASGVGCALSTARWKGPPSDHFDGNTFKSPGDVRHIAGDWGGLSALLKWQQERQPGPWRDYRDEPPGPRPPREVPTGAMRVTFINHATTLIQLDGVNVLTDPIYSKRASPFAFIGPARVRPPGIRFEDLPRIDAVVLSHNHYDHLDVPTLKRIAHAWPGVRIFAGLGNRAFLQAQGLTQVIELDWWESRPQGAISIRSVPNQHFSNRGLFDRDSSLWTAWVFEGKAGRAYFGGDTGYGPHFSQARHRLGPMRLAVLPVGAYRPEWFMGPVHMSPQEAVQAALDLEASVAVPMHFGTFQLADDGETEAIDALKKALTARPAPFVVLGFGEGHPLAEMAVPSPLP